eukprot:TRINITY_DN15552_c0_g1_i2.p1 TRINITY_DN15552_c0_g1~~TRINITY_DN15552_c0_g1_i2.p1  ORF type:complete len:485 (-),score=47.01 TRINITY_DN15552_c0_g1_i2:335-1789(-)
MWNASVVVPSKPPETLHVLGRAAGVENGDIAGQYTLKSVRRGCGIYQLSGKRTALYFHARMGRWVIDREGVTDSEVCVAFADDPSAGNRGHPASPDVLWNVWTQSLGRHVADPKLLAVDAPPALTLLGRAGAAHAPVDGEYALAGVHHGLALYRKRDADIVVKFHAGRSHWMISQDGELDDVCVAYAAAAPTSLHPASPELAWQFWEPQQNAFVADPYFGAVVAPHVVHMLGGSLRRAADDPPMYGSFRLAGVSLGRPVYLLPGTQTTIRYSGRSDRWLLDAEGLEEPSLLSKLYQFIRRGDSGAANDRCTAFAAANGCSHPGCSDLEWHVLDPSSKRHVANPWVCCTTAPLRLRVQGRDSSRQENGAICGDYELCGTMHGRAAYQKWGTTFGIRYFAPRSSWLIDFRGLRDSDECTAYTEHAVDSEHPAGATRWNVFETSRGTYLEDPQLNIVVPEDAPGGWREARRFCRSRQQALSSIWCLM